MDSTVSSTFFFKNGSTVKIGTGSVNFKDNLNTVSVLIANDDLMDAIAELLKDCDRSTQCRFLKILNASLKPARVHR